VYEPAYKIKSRYATHGIYEGSVVKPVGADFVEQKFFRNILVTVGVGRSALCPTWSMV